METKRLGQGPSNELDAQIMIASHLQAIVQQLIALNENIVQIAVNLKSRHAVEM